MVNSPVSGWIKTIPFLPKVNTDKLKSLNLLSLKVIIYF